MPRNPFAQLAGLAVALLAVFLILRLAHGHQTEALSLLAAALVGGYACGQNLA